ncbi:MAG: type III pantothenate kinase, partial [Planctomycetota bacterium]|nr:type III pantothenate kinase [Planctomycetota bacterium]
MKFARFRDGALVGHGRLPLDAPAHAFPESQTWVAVSVNAPVLERLRAECATLHVVGEDVAAPIAVAYDPPEACGLDRVLGVVGAFDRFADAQSVVLFDAGTCLTATLATRADGVLGGAILPGPDLMARALHDGTAALPWVEPNAPRATIGKTTEESIRVGIDAAAVGATMELARRFAGELAQDPLVVATGTGGPALAAA